MLLPLTREEKLIFVITYCGLAYEFIDEAEKDFALLKKVNPSKVPIMFKGSVKQKLKMLKDDAVKVTNEFYGDNDKSLYDNVADMEKLLNNIWYSIIKPVDESAGTIAAFEFLKEKGVELPKDYFREYLKWLKGYGDEK